MCSDLPSTTSSGLALCIGTLSRRDKPGTKKRSGMPSKSSGFRIVANHSPWVSVRKLTHHCFVSETVCERLISAQVAILLASLLHYGAVRVYQHLYIYLDINLHGPFYMTNNLPMLGTLPPIPPHHNIIHTHLPRGLFQQRRQLLRRDITRPGLMQN